MTHSTYKIRTCWSEDILTGAQNFKSVFGGFRVGLKAKGESGPRFGLGSVGVVRPGIRGWKMYSINEENVHTQNRGTGLGLYPEKKPSIRPLQISIPN